jgi:2-hydroxychromene-2-carboxylate isomerase
MADLEFFWDPVCPWAWITSRWVVNVLQERPMDVDWRFISLRMVNHDKDYEKDFAPGYERGHTRGLELLRVAAAARESLGPESVLPLYTAFGERIHLQKDPESFDDPRGFASIHPELGDPAQLGAAATSTEHDDVIRAETKEALDRCGGNIGTPVLSFSPPDGPSFFGPVINVAPKGKDAVDLWDAVLALGSNPHFSELKRSTRGRPQFDD